MPVLPGVLLALPSVLPELLPGVVLGVVLGVALGVLPAPSVVDPLVSALLPVDPGVPALALGELLAEPVVPVEGPVPRPDDEPIALVLSLLLVPRAVFTQSARLLPVAPMLGLVLLELLLPAGEAVELLELPELSVLPVLPETCASARPEVVARTAAAASVPSLLLIFMRGSFGKLWREPEGGNAHARPVGRNCRSRLGSDQSAASSRRIASR